MHVAFPFAEAQIVDPLIRFAKRTPSRSVAVQAAAPIAATRFVRRDAMATKRCLACGRSFRSCPTTPQQNYCSSVQCQRERRTLWQRDKRRTDRDYRDNQARAHQTWLDRHPDYWQQYRSAHPEQVAHNREQQRTRNLTRAKGLIANMDASTPDPSSASGIYRLVPMSGNPIADMGEWIVQITWLSSL